MTIRYDININSAVSMVEQMLLQNAALKVLDVGGAMKPLVYASHVIDMLPYEQRNWYGVIPDNSEYPVRFDKQSWKEYELCDTPWPYRDNEFDIVWCTQTVEDVRDPIAVIREISRIGKRGFLSTVHRSFESMMGTEGYAGYIHHRWLVEPYSDRELRFMFKYPLVHIQSGEYRPTNCESQFIECWWDDEIHAHEYHLTTMQAIEHEFRTYAERYK